MHWPRRKGVVAVHFDISHGLIFPRTAAISFSTSLSSRRSDLSQAAVWRNTAALKREMPFIF